MPLNKLKKYPELLECDVELLQIAYINSFAKRMQELLYENTNKTPAADLEW